MVNLLHDLAELAGEGGQVKQQVLAQRGAAKRGEQFLQFFVRRGVGDVALAIENIFRKFPPDFLIHRLGAGELIQSRAQFLPPGVIRLFTPRKSHHAES
jgi:hypothetical protein